MCLDATIPPAFVLDREAVDPRAPNNRGHIHPHGGRSSVLRP